MLLVNLRAGRGGGCWHPSSLLLPSLPRDCCCCCSTDFSSHGSIFLSLVATSKPQPAFPTQLLGAYISTYIYIPLYIPQYISHIYPTICLTYLSYYISHNISHYISYTYLYIHSPVVSFLKS